MPFAWFCLIRFCLMRSTRSLRRLNSLASLCFSFFTRRCIMSLKISAPLNNNNNQTWPNCLFGFISKTWRPESTEPCTHWQRIEKSMTCRCASARAVSRSRTHPIWGRRLPIGRPWSNWFFVFFLHFCQAMCDNRRQKSPPDCISTFRSKCLSADREKS